METHKRSQTGEVSWTAAPGRLSHSSTGSTSPSVEEEPPDFLHLMDENGIIGLSQAVEGGGWGEFCPGVTSALHDLIGYSETSVLEGARTPPEEPSSNLRLRPSHTKSLCESLVQSNSLKLYIIFWTTSRYFLTPLGTMRLIHGCVVSVNFFNHQGALSHKSGM